MIEEKMILKFKTLFMSTTGYKEEQLEEIDAKVMQALELIFKEMLIRTSKEPNLNEYNLGKTVEQLEAKNEENPKEKQDVKLESFAANTIVPVNSTKYTTIGVSQTNIADTK